ncbi:MAG TPA: hypothetical protein VH370_16480 [Humisphaera sp.]|jgi:hypothetical protein|nr:hypothetical protein [Humisphaera sp.]
MKAIHSLALAAMLAPCFYTLGCETSHTTTDKPGLFGGTTHEETTTTHNPITNTDDKTSVEKKTP